MKNSTQQSFPILMHSTQGRNSVPVAMSVENATKLYKHQAQVDFKYGLIGMAIFFGLIFGTLIIVTILAAIASYLD